MVGTAELESATSCMSSKRSNQLSYAPVHNIIIIHKDGQLVKHFFEVLCFFRNFCQKAPLFLDDTEHIAKMSNVILRKSAFRNRVYTDGSGIEKKIIL